MDYIKWLAASTLWMTLIAVLGVTFLVLFSLSMSRVLIVRWMSKIV